MTAITEPDRDAFDVRPTADEMLARVRAEAMDGRGRLRVYLGMAPGVGKTYRMLEEGHRRLARGTDLVVGFVEPHGRPRTIELLEGLEVVPRRRIEYRGVAVEEMDSDAIIERRPTVALVDELAHTNVPGSLRAKRWQDVEVLRDHGIHVVTTLNIQHLDNVADAVATITGAPVNERLPEDVLLRADEIELVDMSPHALRQRMKHGNVYPPDRTQVALERFFTEANLTALRELALRLVAQRVEGQLEDTVAGRRLPLVTDRVLVLVDGSAASVRAIRRAGRLASALHGAFLAAVVDTPRSERQPFDQARDLQEAIDDAVDLGAEVIRVQAPDVATGLREVSRTRRVTHVVVPYREMAGLGRFRDRPLAERLLEALPDVEVVVVGPGSAGRERRG
jgi:two-component system, OmpR family, sensor histidine kinase KdpD